MNKILMAPTPGMNISGYLRRQLHVLAAVGTLLILTCGQSAVASVVAADWSSTAGGVLNGVGFSVTGVPGSFFGIRDDFEFSGPNFSEPLPLGTEFLEYSSNMDYTITFDSPIDGLLLYGLGWRGNTTHLDDDPSTYTFSESFSILSGFTTATVVGNTMTIDDEFSQLEFGILSVNGPISSLSVMAGGLNADYGQGLTIAQSAIPVPASIWLFGSGLVLLRWSRRKAT